MEYLKSLWKWFNVYISKLKRNRKIIIHFHFHMQCLLPALMHQVHQGGFHYSHVHNFMGACWRSDEEKLTHERSHHIDTFMLFWNQCMYEWMTVPFRLDYFYSHIVHSTHSNYIALTFLYPPWKLFRLCFF